MSQFEETGYYGMEGGCPLHGDEFMRECTMCGAEFCHACQSGLLCPDCQAEAETDDDLAKNPDFEDVASVKDLLVEDDEADRLAEEENELIPLEDLVDDEADDQPRE